LTQLPPSTTHQIDCLCIESLLIKARIRKFIAKANKKIFFIPKIIHEFLLKLNTRHANDRTANEEFDIEVQLTALKQDKKTRIMFVSF
jgi:hypothetical protein